MFVALECIFALNLFVCLFLFSVSVFAMIQIVLSDHRWAVPKNIVSIALKIFWSLNAW